MPGRRGSNESTTKTKLLPFVSLLDSPHPPISPHPPLKDQAITVYEKSPWMGTTYISGKQKATGSTIDVRQNKEQPSGHWFSIRSRRPLTYTQPHTSILAYNYSHFPRTTRIWNKLREATVVVGSIGAFWCHALTTGHLHHAHTCASLIRDFDYSK